MPLAISAVFISGFEQDFAFKETNDESTHYRSSSGKWSSRLISITIQNWTGSRIFFRNIVLLHEIILIDLQKRKKNNVMSEVVARGSSGRKF